ncbi:MAG: hypothetical protein NBV67_02260, partial [Tagaea sp.]|nr:hypothetical protein [Tagaea sp.]
MARRPKTIGARALSDPEFTVVAPCVRVCVVPDFANAAPSFSVDVASPDGRVRVLGAVSRAVSITRQSEGRRRI